MNEPAYVKRARDWVEMKRAQYTRYRSTEALQKLRMAQAHLQTCQRMATADENIRDGREPYPAHAP